MKKLNFVMLIIIELLIAIAVVGALVLDRITPVSFAIGYVCYMLYLFLFYKANNNRLI